MKLIPDYIRDNTKSRAEKTFFDILQRSAGLGDWFCMHSFGLSRHLIKREGEVDFLLIGPLGIFVLEVKGGTVMRQSGVWIFQNFFGQKYTKKESPFQQAQSALYSLKTDLERKFSQSLRNITLGYGVIFPDVVFQATSPEWDNAIICNQKDLEKPIADYIHRLASYWRKSSRSGKKLDQHQIHVVVEYLRGDFEVVMTLFDRTSESENQIANLTAEQTRHLDVAGSNPRILLSGAAGTGKTMLAIEMLKRNKERGMSTLFLCFNVLLASTLKTLLKDCIDGQSYVVDSIHSFMRQYINLSDKEIDAIKNKKELFAEQFPNKFLSAVKLQPIPKFDYLIIDEAQDILSEKYMRVFNHIIKGGMDQGRWLVCLDAENQNIYSSDIDRLLESIKQMSIVLELTINCRNTMEIAQQTELVTGVDFATVVRAEGLPVKYLWYKDTAEQMKKVGNFVKKSFKEGILPKDITILSPKREGLSLVGSNGSALPFNFYKMKPETMIGAQIENAIGHTSISAYKGLENKVIILTDIEDISDKGQISKLLNYVGFTRARSLLVVAMKSNQKKDYLRKAKNFFHKKGLKIKSKLRRN